MSSPNKRKELDVMRLMMADHEVKLIDGVTSEFEVKFIGPKDSLYEGGVWILHVELPPAYPYRSPSIAFKNKIFHPNVDFNSGAVCLDVINQTWTPMYSLVNVFEVFFPQLLMYPNPTDPLNGEAAALQLREPAKYERQVKEYVRLYASRVEEDKRKEGEGSDADSMSSVSSLSSEDEKEEDSEETDPAATMDL